MVTALAVDLGSSSGRIVAGTFGDGRVFRGVFVNWLWMRANELKEAGRYHESVELASAITGMLNSPSPVPTPSITSPNSFFTVTIHVPARGSREMAPDDSPTTTSSVHIPSEKANR